MELVRKLILAFLLCLLVEEQAPCMPSAPTINAQISVMVEGGRKPVILGSTNLPDGLEAVVTVYHGRRIMAAERVVVEDGNFQAGPFSEGGNPYPAGIYTMSLESELSQLQPEKVQAVIGHNGVLLRGPLVGKHPLFHFERIVRLQLTIIIQ